MCSEVVAKQSVTVTVRCTIYCWRSEFWAWHWTTVCEGLLRTVLYKKQVLSDEMQGEVRSGGRLRQMPDAGLNVRCGRIAVGFRFPMWNCECRLKFGISLCTGSLLTLRRRDNVVAVIRLSYLTKYRNEKCREFITCYICRIARRTRWLLVEEDAPFVDTVKQ